MIGWILSVIVFIVVIELIQKKYYRDIYHFNISNNLSINLNCGLRNYHISSNIMKKENKFKATPKLYLFIYIFYIFIYFKLHNIFTLFIFSASRRPLGREIELFLML